MAAVGSRGAHAELVCASRFNLWPAQPNGHPVGSVQRIARALSPSSLMVSPRSRVIPTMILASPFSGCPEHEHDSLHHTPRHTHDSWIHDSMSKISCEESQPFILRHASITSWVKPMHSCKPRAREAVRERHTATRAAQLTGGLILRAEGSGPRVLCERSGGRREGGCQ